MAVFWHDKRRQIVSQNNFADITTIHEEITLFHYANDFIPTSQPTNGNNQQRSTHAKQHVYFQLYVVKKVHILRFDTV